jgi:hypothetical protein
MPGAVETQPVPSISPLAGRPVPKEMLVDLARLEREYFERRPAGQRELGALPFIVEDLGLITPDVYALRDQFHLLGTRVLQFAFDGHSDNPYREDAGGRVTNLNAIVLLADGLEHCLRSRNLG